MNSLTAQKNFRKDINGLRAWAVAFVILYHFGLSGFSGGFIGVDVFFVISGFLMTGIIDKGLKNSDGSQPFSVLKFYLARATRIMPALLVLCAVLVVMGWFVLPPSQYKALGTHAISALTFLSNFTFWREASYFDTSSHEKWLLHTWSLSVEWQFYLILPLLLTAMSRFTRKTTLVISGLTFAGSLACAIALSPTKATSSFYLLPTRAWEMLAGSLVCYSLGHFSFTDRVRKIIEAAGFVLIIAAVLVFDATSNWPGFRASVPVLGAALVLLAARQNSRWTASSVAQWLGNISYSLYLWHWPIVVALFHFGQQRNPVAITLGLVLTLVLGQISYMLVEQRARIYLSRCKAWVSAPAISVAALAIISVSGLIVMASGIPTRLPEVLRPLSDTKFDTAAYREGSCFLRPDQKPGAFGNCVEGAPRAPVLVLLWGDSHAAHLYPMMKKHISRDMRLAEFTSSACPPIMGTDLPNRPNCKAVNEATANWVTANKPTHVVIAANWSEYDWKDMSKTFQWLREAGVGKIYLVGPVPRWRTSLPLNVINFVWQNQATNPTIPTRMSYGLVTGIDQLDKDMALYAQRQDIEYISPFERLCDSRGCLTQIDSSTGNGLTTWDETHLTEVGSAYLSPIFPQFK